MAPIDLPPLVVERATNNGVAGRLWLEQLPAVVAELAERWRLEIGPTYSGGTAGYIAACTDTDGNPLVLKVALPLTINDRDAFTRAVHVHRIADGRGCVRLVAADDATSSMLLERLGPNLAELGLDLPEMFAAITSTLRAFWRPVADDPMLRSGVDQAHWLAGFIDATWRELDQPCEREVIDRAIELCDRRRAAFDPARAVLVHGDAHGWNTVSDGAGAYRFVDPEGLWSEPEHDLAVPMREYNGPLIAGDTSRLVRERAELLAGACDVDPQAVWEWGFIERVSTGLAGLRDFDGDDSAVFLEVARRSR
jgi:streptomycin 6-kinase